MSLEPGFVSVDRRAGVIADRPVRWGELASAQVQGVEVDGNHGRWRSQSYVQILGVTAICAAVHEPLVVVLLLAFNVEFAWPLSVVVALVALVFPEEQSERSEAPG